MFYSPMLSKLELNEIRVKVAWERRPRK